MTKQIKKTASRKTELTVQSVKPVLKASPRSITGAPPAGEHNLPDFKPGNTPHLQYGNEVLNANVPWNEVISDLCSHGLSMAEIAIQLDVELSSIQAVAAKNYSHLNFKAGARLLTLHMQYTAKII